jgi:hypothetical protein
MFVAPLLTFHSASPFFLNKEEELVHMTVYGKEFRGARKREIEREREREEDLTFYKEDVYLRLE